MWIRPILESDIELLYSIDKASFEDNWSMQAIKDMYLSDYDKAALIEVDDKVIGYINWRQNEFEAELLRIAIINDYRGRGISHLLMEYMLTSINKTGSDVSVFLEVRKHNPAAIALYKKHGFEEIGIRKNYYDKPIDDAVLMKLDLGLKGLVYKC